MKIRILLLCIPFLLAGCNGSPDSTPDAGDDPAFAAPALPSDSLRHLYLQYLSEKTDTLPARQIVEAGKLYPVDEALSDTAFFVFRERLLDAVERKDILGVMEVVDENIKNSFGGDNGLAGFTASWGLESEEKTQQSELWRVLGDVLSQGGAFSDGGRLFTAPYVFATWPGQYDAAEYTAITGEGVRLRPEPNLNSRILTMVNYDIVEFLGQTENSETIGGETHPWVHIKTAGGDEGYVWGKFARNPLGYRAIFQRRPDGQWKMVLLAAGD